MCCSPESRALKAQRKLERYNRRHGVSISNDKIITSTATLQTPGTFVHSSNSSDESYDMKTPMTRPPSYRAVMEKEERGADLVTGVNGHVDGVVEAQGVRGRGCGRGGRRGCGVEGYSCGGRRRGGLVAMLFRLVKGEYEAYKESKAGGAGAGGEMIMMRSEKY